MGKDPRSLKSGRLNDIVRMMESLRFHRPAIEEVIGEPDSRRLAEAAGKIIELLKRHPHSQMRGLVVIEGVPMIPVKYETVYGTNEPPERRSLERASPQGGGSQGIQGAGPEDPLVGRPNVQEQGIGVGSGRNGAEIPS